MCYNILLFSCGAHKTVKSTQNKLEYNVEISIKMIIYLNYYFILVRIVVCCLNAGLECICFVEIMRIRFINFNFCYQYKFWAVREINYIFFKQIDEGKQILGIYFS